MENKISVKIELDAKEFIEKLRLNRIKIGSDDEIKSLAETFNLVMKYFKINQEEYLKLVKLGDNKNV